jgi:hypothetical protein
MTRREWLRATGAAGLLFPALRPRRARADAAPPALVLVMQANGTSQPHFWPTGGAASAILEPLLGDPALAARTTAVKGIFHGGEGSGNEHDKGFAGLFSGTRPRGQPTIPGEGGPPSTRC